LSFASSIICFISSALGIAEVVVVVVAGLEAVVVVVVAGLDAVIGAFAAGLEVVGAFGAADGVWATAREAVANRVVSNKVVCLMVGDSAETDRGASSSAYGQVHRFLLNQQS
jgi:hypothetical protein